jgi:hypothetical protein
MSTKIYNAFLLSDTSQLWELLRVIRTRGEKSAQERLDYLADGISSSISDSSEAYKQAREQFPALSDWAIRESITWKQLDDGYKAATVSFYRSPYNFDLNVSVREHQGNLYLIAHEGMGMRNTIVPILQSIPELREYHYQNSTDRPEEIPEDNWEERAQAWNQMATPYDHWWDYLLLEIVCWGNWWRIRTAFDRMKRRHVENKNEA